MREERRREKHKERKREGGWEKEGNISASLLAHNQSVALSLR